MAIPSFKRTANINNFSDGRKSSLDADELIETHEKDFVHWTVGSGPFGHGHL